MQKIALHFNRYYLDEGQTYVKKRLKECFADKGFLVVESKEFACVGEIEEGFSELFSAVVFWNKDITLAKALEAKGIRVFNSSFSIGLCDDKAKTYQHIIKECSNVDVIPTVFAPLSYAKQQKSDKEFLDFVESKLGFPVIIKYNQGSLGKEVFLLHDKEELDKFFIDNSGIAYSCQKRIRPVGIDYRVYTIGGKAVAAVQRKNKKSFISNVEHGGEMKVIYLSKDLIELSEQIATALKLDFGAIDFLRDNNGKLYFLEANSNAYFRAIEGLGVKVAEPIVEYIIGEIK